MKNVNFYMVIKMIVVFLLFLSCSNPEIINNKENESNVDKTEKEFITTLNTLDSNPPKDDLLSEKEVLKKGVEDALNSNLQEIFKNDRKESYQNTSFGEILFIEDNENYVDSKTRGVNDSSDLSSSDYYFVSLNDEDNNLAAVITLDSENGKILEYATLYEDSNIILNKSEDVEISVSKNITRGVDNIESIKPEFIGTVNDYDRLSSWKWVIILKEKVATRSGNRSVFLADPFSNNENNNTNRGNFRFLFIGRRRTLFKFKKEE